MRKTRYFKLYAEFIRILHSVLPNNIVEELNHQKLTAKLSLIHDSVLVNNNNFKDYIPTDEAAQ
jgi:hypothetical protein